GLPPVAPRGVPWPPSPFDGTPVLHRYRKSIYCFKLGAFRTFVPGSEIPPNAPPLGAQEDADASTPGPADGPGAVGTVAARIAPHRLRRRECLHPPRGAPHRRRHLARPPPFHRRSRERADH